MGPRIQEGRKKGKALGAAVRAQLGAIRSLARDLNAESRPIRGSGATDADGAHFAGQRDEIRPAAQAVVEATLSAPYPKVSDDAAQRFNALADQAPLHYVAGLWRPEDAGQHFITIGGGHAVLQRSATPQGVWVALLADFLINPQRDRLRRCPVCGRWFVDATRNRSARRCSRKCTIVWSNAQRDQKAQTPIRRKREGRR